MSCVCQWAQLAAQIWGLIVSYCGASDAADLCLPVAQVCICFWGFAEFIGCVCHFTTVTSPCGIGAWAAVQAFGLVNHVILKVVFSSLKGNQLQWALSHCFIGETLARCFCHRTTTDWIILDKLWMPSCMKFQDRWMSLRHRKHPVWLALAHHAYTLYVQSCSRMILSW